ncbi:MAG TPA: methylated-DNA--[protein]-cysteine S-methyltransferase [Chloroflexota bacterium]|nr:methylated-DNA--[protein]-cysteine S-methyltransferase [Chloroflexota bacterium]
MATDSLRGTAGEIWRRHLRWCPACQAEGERVESLARVWAKRDSEDGDGPAYAALDTPLGAFWAAWDGTALIGASLGGDEAEFVHAVERATGTILRWAPEAIPVLPELAAFWEGADLPPLPFRLQRVTPFRRAVFEAVARIPRGAVASYGDIADMAGRPGGAQAAGQAIARNPISLAIPCHRIIRADGTLGEYGPSPCGVVRKAVMLSLEGVGVEIDGRPCAASHVTATNTHDPPNRYLKSESPPAP